MSTHFYKTPLGTELPKSRKHLNADALFGTIRDQFAKIKDPRPGQTSMPLDDVLMSAFAMFSLKDPSLLAFEQRRQEDDLNLTNVYGIKRVPSDTRMREVLDDVDPEQMRSAFNAVFAQVQRGKGLEQLRFLEEYFLISGDGTGYYYSQKVGNDSCLTKSQSGGSEKAFHQQFYGAALVHPDFREVIPLFPEPIVKQDGQSKNDCEQMAARRFMAGFRKDHPHLSAVLVEDALHSKAPHIRDLQAHNIRFIIGAKENDHSYLFQKVFEEEQACRSTNIILDDPKNRKVKHNFFFVNGIPLNKANPDLSVNFLEYWEIRLDDHGNELNEEQLHFGWVTDLEITKTNVREIMRGGRARWKIENETFNTLKNQGYHLGHNFGLGKKHLSKVFLVTTMLAFMVDQVQQLCCGLFRASWAKSGSKRALWEKMRSYFQMLELDSMETLLKLICFGFKKPTAKSLLNTC